ncbi:hypothetical protein HBO07_11330 [Pseudomonas proteolytica]|uniref:hypothetical protein n=1 Tax=Pseudomonas proteolytica TaxID=219574 RepID=UPI00147663C1|nr:hypothetical protein [Pseudomonas proteolytica]NMZ11872.1 hypothetical protein [Pseudomonas proteolytica]
MNDRIQAEILKLKADAIGVVFTGFITHARVEPPAMLTGEIWGHVCADGFGNFADGHRIETSDISEIHSRGESLWITTRSGSDYGILSFAPLGWTYFADLYKAHLRLDHQVPGSPIWHMALSPEPIPRLARKPRERPSREPESSSAEVLTRNLLRPEENTKYMDQMEVFVKKTIETLERNGLKTFKPRR